LGVPGGAIQLVDDQHGAESLGMPDRFLQFRPAVVAGYVRLLVLLNDFVLVALAKGPASVQLGFDAQAVLGVGPRGPAGVYDSGGHCSSLASAPSLSARTFRAHSIASRAWSQHLASCPPIRASHSIRSAITP